MSNPSPWVAGVDGCRAGWLAVLRAIDGGEAPRACIVTAFAELLALPEAPLVIAIDIPIGLPERSGIGGRQADVEARVVLGNRRASVFAVPARAAVMETDYRTACAVALAHSDPPRRVSKQAFNLFPRIREIDAHMTPTLQGRVYECHPEAAFWAMNGAAPLGHPKKLQSRPHEPGLALRRMLLERAGFVPDFMAEARFPASVAGPDDFLDACACCWTAGRLLAGTAHCFPAIPPLDGRGLRQEIRA